MLQVKSIETLAFPRSIHLDEFLTRHAIRDITQHLHLHIGHRHALIVNPIPERNVQQPGQLISVVTQSGQIGVINQIEASTTTIDQIEFIALVEISVTKMRNPLRSKCS